MATFSDALDTNLNNWTQDVGSWSIVSSTHAESSTASQRDTMRVTTAFDGDDHHAYCSCRGGSLVNVRKASSTHTCYAAFFNGAWTGSESWSIGKLITNTWTALQSGTDQGWPTTVKIEITCEGANNTTLTGKLDDAYELTDSTNDEIDTGTYMGLSSTWGVAGWFEDFYGEDVAAGAATPKNRVLQGPFSGPFNGPF